MALQEHYRNFYIFIFINYYAPKFILKNDCNKNLHTLLTIFPDTPIPFKIVTWKNKKLLKKCIPLWYYYLHVILLSFMNCFLRIVFVKFLTLLFYILWYPEHNLIIFRIWLSPRACMWHKFCAKYSLRTNA